MESQAAILVQGGRGNLQQRFAEFAKQWEANKQPCDGLSGPSRTAAESLVQDEIERLFEDVFLSLAATIVDVYGNGRFDDGTSFEFPPKGGDQLRYPRWLTKSDNTRIAAKKLLFWSACAADPEKFDRGIQYRTDFLIWVKRVFLCAPQKGEPNIARGINQWIKWVAKLLHKLDINRCAIGDNPFNSLVTSKSCYRQWQIEAEIGDAMPFKSSPDPIPAPCERLLALGWETDRVPVDLSVEAINKLFDCLISIPENLLDCRGELYADQFWPGALLQDYSEYVRDGHRLVTALAIEHRWTDAIHEPITPGVNWSAHDAILQLGEVRRYLASKVTPQGQWQTEPSANCPASEVNEPPDPLPMLIDSSDFFTWEDVAWWIHVSKQTVSNRLTKSRKRSLDPQPIQKHTGRRPARFAFEVLREWLIEVFPDYSRLIPLTIEDARQRTASKKAADTKVSKPVTR